MARILTGRAILEDALSMVVVGRYSATEFKSGFISNIKTRALVAASRERYSAFVFRGPGRYRTAKVILTEDVYLSSDSSISVSIIDDILQSFMISE